MALGIQELTSKINFHYSVDGGDGVVFGGLHTTRAGAERAKRKLVDKAKKVKIGSPHTPPYGRDDEKKKQEYVAHWQNMPIKHLRRGESYTPFGLGAQVQHGINDGTHGSRADGFTLSIIQPTR